jgi:hypothetical protein
VGYEGGNVPKEMADCAMADILSTIIIRRAAFVFVVSKELVFPVFFLATFGKKKFWTREFFRERDEREKSRL